MTIRTHPLGRILLGFGAVMTPFRRTKAAAELSHLDDRMLKDIGLTRCDVEAMRRTW